jgi:alpha-tubulin suppressor-like RCC1 family protein
LLGSFPGSSYGLISALEAIKLYPYLVGSEVREAKFIGGACAVAHCFLVDDQGEVWGCGSNVAGMLGLVSHSTLVTRLLKYPAHKR